MKSTDKIKDIVFGNSLKYETEELLIITLTFVAMLMSAFATTFNIILHLSTILIIITSISTTWFGLLYYAARLKKWYLLTKNITVISVMGLLDLMWLNNAGSLGPMTLVLVMVVPVFLFLFDGWKRFAFILIYIANLVLQFYIEHNYSNIITQYINQEDRMLDFYSGFVINISLSAVLIIYIKKLYIQEKNKAIESEKLKSAFLANLSHEIRTPMNGIIGFSEMLNRPNLTEEKRIKYTKVIVENSQRLLSMVNDVLDMSKLEAGSYPVLKNNVNIELLTLKLSQFYELKSKEKGLVFNRENLISDKNFMFYTDEQILWQVLSNLLNNAVKFTSSGSITLISSIENNELVFTVADTGIGIEKQYHSLIFERFRQVDNSMSKLKGGSGLGLSISKNLINLIGGNISLESSPDKGSSFFIKIPLS